MNNTNPIYLQEINLLKYFGNNKSYRNTVAATAKGLASPKTTKATLAYTIASSPFPCTATIPVGAFTMLPSSLKRRLGYAITTGDFSKCHGICKALGCKMKDLIATVKSQGFNKEALNSMLS